MHTRAYLCCWVTCRCLTQPYSLQNDWNRRLTCTLSTTSYLLCCCCGFHVTAHWTMPCCSVAQAEDVRCFSESPRCLVSLGQIVLEGVDTSLCVVLGLFIAFDYLFCHLFIGLPVLYCRIRMRYFLLAIIRLSVTRIAMLRRFLNDDLRPGGFSAEFLHAFSLKKSSQGPRIERIHKKKSSD